MSNSYSTLQQTRKHGSLPYNAGLHLEQDNALDGYDNTYGYNQSNLLTTTDSVGCLSSLTNNTSYPQPQPSGPSIYHVASYRTNQPIRDNGLHPFEDEETYYKSLRLPPLDQFHPKNIGSAFKRPHRLYYPDAPDEPEAKRAENKEGLGTKLERPRGCGRCKVLKVKCEFKTDRDPCKRCLNGGHECIIPARRKLRAPPKREHLLNQIREQATQIQKLMSQLEATNTPSVSQDSDNVSSDEVNMDADTHSRTQSLFSHAPSNTSGSWSQSHATYVHPDTVHQKPALPQSTTVPPSRPYISTGKNPCVDSRRSNQQGSQSRILPGLQSADLDADPDKLAIENPLAGQILKMYLRDKASLPHTLRVENITWRMMALALKKRKEGDGNKLSEKDNTPFVKGSNVFSISSSSPPPSESLNEVLQSLLVALTELRTVQDPLVNGNTVLLFRKLLAIPDAAIAFGVETANSDVELLFDFFLCLFCHGSIQVSRDAKRMARKLMFKLISKTNILPRSLFITDIEKDPQAIAVGGFGRVFKGKYGGKLVALKMLYHGRRTGDSIEKNFYTEAVAWRSLSHRFILPLLGIYEEGPQLFLVSPFMTNGALREWRKDHIPVQIDEIRRLLLEVAEGVQYIHSEGIVHGDLHGGNVLVDSEFHCQITDFGSTRHCDVTATRSTTTLSLNFAPPELFGMCATCGELDCEESHNVDEEQHKIKTKKTDVYAFGCLYYSIFFDTVPFREKRDFQIIRLVTKGVRPDRLENPIMEEHTWNLVQRCWKSKPSERPTMEAVVTELTP